MTGDDAMTDARTVRSDSKYCDHSRSPCQHTFFNLKAEAGNLSNTQPMECGSKLYQTSHISHLQDNAVDKRTFFSLPLSPTVEKGF